MNPLIQMLDSFKVGHPFQDFTVNMLLKPAQPPRLNAENQHEY